MKNQSVESIQIEFSDNSILSSLFGVADSNIQLLEKINNVKIEYRGNVVNISGNKLNPQLVHLFSSLAFFKITDAKICNFTPSRM